MEISGLSLTVIGMTVVFLALALLALTAWILERVFRTKDSGEKREVLASTSDVEAVIALALSYYIRKKGSLHIHAVDESVWMQQTRVYT